jgi:hypothetical protein
MTETEFESIPETLPEELASIAETAGTVANGEPPVPESGGPSLTVAEREHYLNIISLNYEVARQQAIYDRVKAELKYEKEYLEKLHCELSSLISTGPQKPDPQKVLPFAELDATAEPSPAAAVDPDAWKSVPIEDVLILTKKQLETLHSHGIKSVGMFENVRAGLDPDYLRGLRSIKGFGEKTIDAMENDIVNWLAANAREAEPEETEEDAE